MKEKRYEQKIKKIIANLHKELEKLDKETNLISTGFYMSRNKDLSWHTTTYSRDKEK